MFIPNDPKKQAPKQCTHREHNPPSMWVPPAQGGTWVCPACGKKTVIRPKAYTL